MADDELPWPSWATEHVEIVDYDAAWACAGVLECARLQRFLTPWLTGEVEHVGSTAVPGLPAKPIIDLQAPVNDLDAAADVAAVLASHDWHFVPPALDQRPYRRFFVKVFDGRRIAHLHLLRPDGERWSHQLVFRDALRADPAVAPAYARLKVDLAEHHRGDREAYTAAKGRFVDAVVHG